MRSQSFGALTAFLLFSGAASADVTNECGMPTIETDDVGATLILTYDAAVQTKFCNGTAGFSSNVFVDTSYLPTSPIYFATGNVTPVGNIVNIGAFPSGSELIFFIEVTDTGDVFYSGPGSRNPDGLVHAFVKALSTPIGDEFYIGFEDLFGGGDGDFDDIQFIVRLELDEDGDGVGDLTQDLCLDTEAGDVVDADGCSIAQLCPCDDPWKNHGAYVSCVAHAAEEFVESELITDDEKDVIASAAAQSSCGAK
ncbi:hypothetical protein [Sorangium sp. So ce363]|uniref:hypothetical protein n=1 Tax=Sorangium sp. So ce363 TaxID=3133304 RepID=UPI003F5ECCF1